jgi:hypothetical protein
VGREVVTLWSFSDQLDLEFSAVRIHLKWTPALYFVKCKYKCVSFEFLSVDNELMIQKLEIISNSNGNVLEMKVIQKLDL